jgi:methyl-accepting chemotaxis protein
MQGLVVVRLKYKLVALVVAGAVAAGALVWLGQRSLGGVQDSVDEVFAQELTYIGHVASVSTDVAAHGRIYRVLPYLDNEQEVREHIERGSERERVFLAELESMRKTAPDSEALALVEQFGRDLEAYLELCAKMEQAMLSGGQEEADAMSEEKILPAARDLDQSFDTLREQAMASAKASYGESKEVAAAASTRNWWLLCAVGCALLALGAVVATRVERTLGGEPEYALEVVQRVAAGDLTVQVATRPGDRTSLLAAMAEMVNQLNGTVSNIREAAEAIAATSAQVASSSSTLSQNSSEQASNVEETNASVQQVASAVAENSKSSKTTEERALHSARQANEGSRVVIETTQAMTQIAEKIGIVDEIAYQTNLLALNAAIEAARAGEHGRGFAVVAAEVRKLAERCQVAALEIGGLARGSAQLAERAAEMLSQVVPTIEGTAELVQGITRASMEQSQGLEQVALAMSHLSRTTQSNASASEELSATASEMRRSTQVLRKSVATFRVKSGQSRLAPAGGTTDEHTDDALADANMHELQAPTSRSKKLFALGSPRNSAGDSSFERF